jgi:large-conductance mechanosensitive channel
MKTYVIAQLIFTEVKRKTKTKKQKEKKKKENPDASTRA